MEFFTIGTNVDAKRFKRKCLYKTGSVAYPIRLDALMSYHDSLAGGGHLGMDKVKSSLIQNIIIGQKCKGILQNM